MKYLVLKERGHAHFAQRGYYSTVSQGIVETDGDTAQTIGDMFGAGFYLLLALPVGSWERVAIHPETWRAEWAEQ